MTVDELKWLAGILVPLLTLNASLINISLNDKIKNPLRIAVIINILYIIIGGWLVFSVTKNALAILGVVFTSLILLGILFYILKQRDLTGISFGERLLEVSHLVDIQLSYILVELVNGIEPDQFELSIRNGLKYILDLIGEFIGFDRKINKNHSNGHHSLSLFFVRDDGKFDVLAQKGITSTQIEYIERKFRYKNKINSIAGYAVNKGVNICIPDLAKCPNDILQYWTETEKSEKRDGFILCYLIFRGVGDSDIQAKPMAVICISSHDKNAYDSDSIYALLDHFSPQIENMLYAYLLLEKSSLE